MWRGEMIGQPIVARDQCRASGDRRLRARPVHRTSFARYQLCDTANERQQLSVDPQSPGDPRRLGDAVKQRRSHRCVRLGPADSAGPGSPCRRSASASRRCGSGAPGSRVMSTQPMCCACWSSSAASIVVDARVRHAGGLRNLGIQCSTAPRDKALLQQRLEQRPGSPRDQWWWRQARVLGQFRHADRVAHAEPQLLLPAAIAK